MHFSLPSEAHSPEIAARVRFLFHEQARTFSSMDLPRGDRDQVAGRRCRSERGPRFAVPGKG